MSTENEQDTQKIEMDIQMARHKIELLRALKNLQKNKDFQLLILNEFFVNEASRAVLLKATEAAQTDGIQAGLIRKIDAIGTLNQFLYTVEQMGEMAAAGIAADQGTHAELLDEAD